jgi:hypothetical protein
LSKIGGDPSPLIGVRRFMGRSQTMRAYEKFKKAWQRIYLRHSTLLLRIFSNKKLKAEISSTAGYYIPFPFSPARLNYPQKMQSYTAALFTA